MKFNDRTFFTLAIFLTVLVFVIVAIGYQPKSRLVPLAIGIPTLLLTFFQLLIDMIPAVERRFRFLADYDVFGADENKVAENGAGASGQRRAGVRRRELEFSAWLFLLMALIYFLGFLVAIPLFLLLFLKLHSGAGWRITLAITGSTWLFVYVVFIVVMDAPLHGGVVW